MKRSFTRVLGYLLLLLIVGITVFPVYYLTTLSLKNSVDMYAVPPRFVFTPTIGNFVSAFQQRPVHLFLINSIVVSAVTTALSVFIASLGGYGFSRYSFKGKRLAMFSIIATRMIPPVTLVFPMFLIMRNLGILNSRLSLILAYTTFNIPFGVMILTGFFDTIPRELEESAFIDGCGRLRSYFQVILPLSRAGIAAAMILAILLSWKDYLWAVRLTYTPASQTLPVLITTFLASNDQNWPAMTSIAVLSIVPIFLFSLISQKHLIAGLTAGALKG